MPTLTPIRRTFLIIAALLLATAVVYWPVAGHQYLSLDDYAYVARNNVVQDGLTWNGVVWAFNGAHVANYHPLTWLSHMLDCQLFGSGPRAAHLVNLALHAVNGVLLFLVLRWMTGREWCSAFVAAVFALHPQHVESVAWVAERKDVLSGLFWIATLGAWAWYVQGPSAWKYALALFAFMLGLLSKPMVVTLPCVLLLLDFWPLRRMNVLAADPTAAGGYRRSIPFLLIEKIPFFALSIAACAATMWAQSAGGAVTGFDDLSLGFRLGNAIVAYAAYARKFLWPSDLAAFYPLLRPWPLVTVLGSAAVLLVVTAAVVLKGRSKPYLPVGWLWFLGTLVPVIGLVQVGNQSMADRYMYLPMIGLAVMVAWWAADTLRGSAARFNVVGAGTGAAVALVGLAIVTAVDVRAWKDTETLIARSLERTEPSAFGYHVLASAKLQSGKTNEALELYKKCVDIQPGNPNVRRAYAIALRGAKRYEQAFEQFQLAIELGPEMPANWIELGSLHLDRQQWPEAVKALSEAARLAPDDFDNRLNLAVAHRLTGDMPASLRQFEVALRLNARLARPWCGYGALLLEMDRPADAVEPLRRSVAIDPNLGEAQYQLGVALMRVGRGQQALQPLMNAMTLDPNSPAVMTRLAWVLATHPDAKLRRGHDAIFFAHRAVQLTRAAAPEELDALAAAQAELKQFDQAIATATRALEVARGTGNAALVGKIEQRVERYRAHEAVRDGTLVGADAGEALP